MLQLIMDAAEQAALEQELAEHSLLFKQNQLLLEKILSNWANWERQVEVAQNGQNALSGKLPMPYWEDVTLPLALWRTARCPLAPLKMSICPLAP